ncbi:MAG: Rieske 2Fe-2S domain-containing protein [Phycisphaerales bacterium]|nr:Rieske 2Fe-2S domain-containing protein [Phycisphaerales bacterium]
MEKDGAPHAAGRRGFITTVAMVGGLIAGYGHGLYRFFEYLVPLKRTRKTGLFVGTLNDIPVGRSLTVHDPQGHTIAIARTSESAENPAAGFKALSSRCPHLGCNVHWESGSQQFVCPCHNGIFDKNGVALSGPPAAEGKNLREYALTVDAKRGWVFVEVTVGSEI